MGQTVEARPPKATNVTLPADVYEEGKALELNFSRVFEQAMREAIRAERGRREPGFHRRSQRVRRAAWSPTRKTSDALMAHFDVYVNKDDTGVAPFLVDVQSEFLEG